MYLRRGEGQRLGGCGALIVGLIFLIVGGGLLFYTSSSYFNAQRFPEARCTILKKNIVTNSSTDSDGNVTENYAPSFSLHVQPNNRNTAYDTQGSYSANQVSTNDYNQVSGIVNRFEVGQVYQCWYDPSNPSYTLLDRSPNLLFLGISTLFTLIGLLIFFSGVQRIIRKLLLLLGFVFLGLRSLNRQ